MAACDLGQEDDPEEVLRRYLQSRGPCLINAPIHLREQVFPIVPPGAANRDLIGAAS